MAIKFPSEIERLTESKKYTIDKIGMSGGTIIIFDDMVLKFQMQSEEAENEVIMMKWLEGKLLVPKIIHSQCEDGVNYILMSKIHGKVSCDDYYMNHAKKLVTLLAEALKELWSIDISSCPYKNNIENKLRLAKYNIGNGLVDMDDFEPETFSDYSFKTPQELLNYLSNNRPKEQLVFSHGDFCLPNILFDNNKLSGFIDLGRAGVADKWQDIALCYRSLKHNFAGYFGSKRHYDFNADLLFEILGIEPDWEKIEYYILLDELF